MQAVLRVVLVASLIGCGPGDDAADAGPSMLDGGPEGFAVAPEIPWLADSVPPLMIAPCPDGWREVGGGAQEPTTCEPYPEGGARDCPAGHAHFPGEPACAPVGAPCPAGDFADGLPSDRRVVYVRPGATGGDGTEALPYGAIGEFALGGLPMASVIALSRGMHDGVVVLSRRNELWGACAEETILSTKVPDPLEHVVTMLDEGGVVRDLTVADSPRAGIGVGTSDAVGRIEGVVVRGVEGLGVFSSGGPELTARSLVVRDVRPRVGGMVGTGLVVQMGVAADVGRAVLQSNRQSGLSADGAGTALTLADVVVRDTAPRASDDGFGRGLGVQRGATAVVMRALFERNREAGVLAASAGTSVMLADTVVRDTTSQESDGLLGRGLNVQFGASASVNRALFDHNTESGVFVGAEDASATLADVVVRDTEARSADRQSGRGFLVQSAAALTADRAVLERNTDHGVFVHGARVTLADVVVRDTRPLASDNAFGRGLNVQQDSTADVSRALLDRNLDLAAYVSEAGSAAMFTDLVVRDTGSRVADQRYGRGLSVQRAAVVDVHRAAFEGNRHVAVTAINGADLTLTDLFVFGTRPQECVDTTCPGNDVAHGVGSYGGGAQLRATRFEVRDSAICGVNVGAESGLDLAEGEVTGNRIGACVQSDGYDVARLTTGVRYDDNETNLQTTTLPVPEPGEVGDVVAP